MGGLDDVRGLVAKRPREVLMLALHLGVGAVDFRLSRMVCRDLSTGRPVFVVGLEVGRNLLSARARGLQIGVAVAANLGLTAGSAHEVVAYVAESRSQL